MKNNAIFSIFSHNDTEVEWWIEDGTLFVDDGVMPLMVERDYSWPEAIEQIETVICAVYQDAISITIH